MTIQKIDGFFWVMLKNGAAFVGKNRLETIKRASKWFFEYNKLIQINKYA